ncbi:CHASE2 domain-containing protein [[Limnothrix rosea] IAM M-220]|uniref:CHASE2 domain-containing protein n=1 Tax=[Limnothrix rosea] IAM M-220 TaxID=454133 RepID=UPI0015585083|nr:CHASE2 domain-containing protein [[Limnothrix rosea] IAM M-220]
MLFKQIWQSIREQWLGVILIAPGVAIAISALSEFGVLQGIEWLTLDQIVRLRPKEAIDHRITLVTIDESDIRFAQQWPISDQLMAQMLYNLAAKQPRVIGIDIFRDTSIEPGRAALTRAFQENPNIIGIEQVFGDRIPPPFVLAELNQVAASDLLLDRDGKIRRGYLSMGPQQSFGARLADMYLRQEEGMLETQTFSQDESIFPSLTEGDRGYVSPRTDFEGHQTLINYRGGLEAFHRISFQDVIENQIPEELIRDRLVLVGTTASSLNDVFVTPYSSRFLQPFQHAPGVVIHSTIASQIISHILDDRPILRPINSVTFHFWVATWALTGAIAAKILAIYTSSIFRTLLITTIGSLILVGLSLSGTFQGFMIPVLTPFLSLVSSNILSTNYESRKRLKQINQELAIANEKLANYSRNLEQEVGDRTAELSATLKDLQVAQISLVQAEKMAALGQMVAGIAHEINNPINYISGNVAPARKYVDELLGIIDLFLAKYPDSEIEEYLEEVDLKYLRYDFYKLLESIAKGAHRVEDIVLSLRTFSHLDESELKQTDLLKDLESTLLVISSSRITNRDDHRIITLEKKLKHLPLVECYPAKINQVILSLLDNAVDAIEENFRKNRQIKGKITIEARSLNNQQIIIQITDNGVGIPENLLSKIFNPFFTTKPVGKGTGMGLAIAHSIIVEQHHGLLSCRNTEDGHTEFTIVLPIVHQLYLTSLTPFKS